MGNAKIIYIFMSKEIFENGRNRRKPDYKLYILFYLQTSKN